MILFGSVENTLGNILAALCILVVIGIVCFVGYVIWMFIDDSTQMRRRQVDEAKDDFNDKKNKFDEIISNFLITHMILIRMRESSYTALF